MISIQVLCHVVDLKHSFDTRWENVLLWILKSATLDFRSQTEFGMTSDPHLGATRNRQFIGYTLGLLNAM